MLKTNLVKGTSFFILLEENTKAGVFPLLPFSFIFFHFLTFSHLPNTP